MKDSMSENLSDHRTLCSIPPYELYTGELFEPGKEVLRGRGVDEFPSAYTPPSGESDKWSASAGLITVWKDITTDDRGIKLETIWQPIWDFLPVNRGQGELYFFQDSSNEKKASGKCPMSVASGQFHWPKRYHLWEIAFSIYSHHTHSFSDAAEHDRHVHAMRLTDALVSVTIGEKRYLEAPLSIFASRDRGSSPPILFLPLPLPLYIPPVQNFMVSLRWDFKNGCLSPIPGNIRCVLGGYLSREIC